MRVALCQINTTPGDIAGNGDRILEWYRRAVDLGAELVVFPELAVCGYPPRDLLEQRDFLAVVDGGIARLCSHIHQVPVIVGAPVRHSQSNAKPLSNAALLLDQGAVSQVVRKKLLPTYDVFDEARHFEPDASVSRPISLGGLQWGIHICEDAWNQESYWGTESRMYSRDPVQELAREGADVLLNISASPFHSTKNTTRLTMLQSHVKELGLPLLYTNQVGGNDALIFDGESFALDPSGSLVAGIPFVEEILLVEVEKTGITGKGSWRIDTGSVEEVRPWKPLKPVEAIHRALVLGLRDYARKCGFTQALLGLSGGIDSAVTCALAVHALGAENVWGVGMPSRYSSQGSIDDARELAELLGIRFDILSIEPLYTASLNTLEELFRDTEPGLAEENLQARARGLLLMGLSNKFGHLLLSTGNKSEVATGYSTLYGDMAGGLAVLSDVPKTTVYELARWMNRSVPTIPENSITKPPSAELRPDQTDQDSLPSYDTLDAIMRGFLEDDLTLEHLMQRGHSEDDVKQVLTLLSRAEYKRRQAPPGLRISPKAFGLGRRLPIATPWKGFREDGSR